MKTIKKARTKKAGTKRAILKKSGLKKVAYGYPSFRGEHLTPVEGGQNILDSRSPQRA